jgi:hypothetical protein
MPRVEFTVAEIKLPPQGKDKGSIITTDGRRFGCFREKFGSFQLNGTYQAEVTDGQYCNIVSAKLLAAASPPTTASTPQPNGNGYGNGFHSPSPQAAPFRTPEQIFVQGVVEAYISAGRCANPAELKDTMVRLRDAFRVTFPAE